jgi:competence protein ComEC
MPFYDRELDMMILTHPHADHVIGLIAVLKKYRVRYVYLTGVLHTTHEYRELLEALEELPYTKKIRVDHPFTVFVEDQVTMRFLYPDFAATVPAQNVNNTSIVVKLEYQDASFLFTGDIEREGEAHLVERYRDALDSDVLKVAHQGSRTSSSESFLEAVSPAQAVITVGRNNPYGHPHRETLERLRKRGVVVLSTLDQGDILITE